METTKTVETTTTAEHTIELSGEDIIALVNARRGHQGVRMPEGPLVPDKASVMFAVPYCYGGVDLDIDPENLVRITWTDTVSTIADE